MNDPRSGGKLWCCHCGTRFVPQSPSHRFCVKCSPKFVPPPAQPVTRSYSPFKTSAPKSVSSLTVAHKKICVACSAPFSPARPYFRWCETCSLSFSNAPSASKTCELCASSFSPSRHYFKRCDECDMLPAQKRTIASSPKPSHGGGSMLPLRSTAPFKGSHRRSTYAQAVGSHGSDRPTSAPTSHMYSSWRKFKRA